MKTRLDIKIGQQSLDQEFIVNPNGAYFLNTMFGWPLVPSVDLPAGGPAYPLLRPRHPRLRFRPVDALMLLAGVYDRQSARRATRSTPQRSNRVGHQLSVNDGALIFAEVQYTYPAIGGMEDPGQGAPLGHTYRLGGWYDTGRFFDQRFDVNGASLASPDSNGAPRQHRGDYSIYAVADQMVWRKAMTPNLELVWAGDGHAAERPQPCRLQLECRRDYHDPFEHRGDTSRVWHGLCACQPAGGGLDGDAGALAAARSIGATYQYQLFPWWQLQPDIQYVFNPGAGIANPQCSDESQANPS